ncbi:MAG: hypothetical protein BAJALOKI1v1_120005 [Promethearchaeota archaeon]|nr:MAG: hypothetical protein BAJALOKI1v1_120005 [Candidatus Lokiarchaeota archaeon]
MARKKKYAYCITCRRHVKKPKRKKLTSYHYQILVIATIATLGIGLLAFILYRLCFQKKKYCPECRQIVKFYRTKEEFPTKVAVKHLEERLELEKMKEQRVVIVQEQDEDEFLIEPNYVKCSYCGENIEEDIDVCPFCGKVQ